jgi:hypothetical protein
MWFHQGCLKEATKKTSLDHYDDEISKLLGGVPIVRGQNGALNVQERDWHIVGTGRRLKKVKEWVNNDSLPSDWKEQLGAIFVHDMLRTKWSFYCCPTCQKDI